MRFEGEIIEYVNADYITASLVEFSHNTRITRNGYMRTQQLIILLVGILYLCYNYNKYSLMIYSYQIPIGIIFVIILMLLQFIHKRIIIHQPGQISIWVKNNESILYKWFFLMVSVITLLFIGFIILRNRLTLYPIEEMVIISDTVSITEIFNITERSAYSLRYLSYLQRTPGFDNDSYIYIKNVIEENLKDITLMSMNDIRNKVIDIFFNSNEEVAIDNRSFFEKIKAWVLTKIYYNK